MTLLQIHKTHVIIKHPQCIRQNTTLSRQSVSSNSTMPEVIAHHRMSTSKRTLYLMPYSHRSPPPVPSYAISI